ncbi:SseB family protein [Nocardioides sp. W7]|uniref:SseB family protein n=1 Tax=Nocardioides sp. W7 TaxID=2931390 RepID=UPI001FD07623|nr:SseB family protein [Nocardioides sp. W7]
MEQAEGAGRELLGPAYPDDTGAVPDEVAAALAAYDAAPGDARAYAEVIAALQRSRLLVPVVAVLGEVEVDENGLARDKSSDMAAVLITGADGRLALLAFTGVEPMAAWDPAARPVPVLSQLAAQSAIQEGAAALVVDLAGPVRFVVEGEDLRGLAAGWVLAQVGDRPAWVRPSD